MLIFVPSKTQAINWASKTCRRSWRKSAFTLFIQTGLDCKPSAGSLVNGLIRGILSAPKIPLLCETGFAASVGRQGLGHTVFVDMACGLGFEDALARLPRRLGRPCPHRYGIDFRT